MSRRPRSAATQATIIASPLAALRDSAAAGVVLAVFERSAYLHLDGRVVALASAKLDPGPLSIGVSDLSALAPLNPGQEATLHGGELRIGPAMVGLREARVWDAALPPAPRLRARGDGESAAAPAGTAGAAMPEAREVAEDELRRGAPAGSVALFAALAAGLDAVAAFLSGRAGQAETARAVASQIAGRGPGLTPSGDDLLIGIVHAVTVWPGLAARAGGAPAVRDLLVGAALPCTTRVSGAYLEAARHGWASAPWHALVCSLGERPDATRAAVRRLLRTGETSGADALTGFCWAWRRVAA